MNLFAPLVAVQRVKRRGDVHVASSRANRALFPRFHVPTRASGVHTDRFGGGGGGGIFVGVIRFARVVARRNIRLLARSRRRSDANGARNARNPTPARA